MKTYCIPIFASLVIEAVSFGQTSTGPFMANGIKIGEVDQDSATVWMRLTKDQTYRLDGETWEKDDEAVPAGKALGDMQYSAIGATGEVRVSYWPNSNRSKRITMDWVPVTAKRNYSVAVKVEGLSPWTRYNLEVEGRGLGETRPSVELMGVLGLLPIGTRRKR